ncbi:MAG: SCO family protein [Hydrogenobacter sp.]
MRKVFLILFLVSLTHAYSNLPKDSYFDPEVLRIDQELYLGKKLKNYTILTDRGWTDLYSVINKKPTILQLAYYTCDASCPILTENLLKAVKDLNKEEFNVLILSFDKRDSIETLKAFKSKLGSVPDNWTFGVLQEEDIKDLTQSVGFKFFFSERDKTFVHPNTLIFLSPDGKVMRYLFGIFPRTKDISLALIDAQREKPTINNIIDLALLACYRYDPHRSRYVVDPVVIFALMGFGLIAITGLLTLTFKKVQEV